jgi:hypothetical protein
MVLICECGSHEIRITDAEESRREDGYVVSFEEDYKCPECGRTGKYYSFENNSNRLTGCLTRSSGGVW